MIFPKGYSNRAINDSKKLKEADREALVTIIESDALSYSVAKCSPKEIDKINILNASIKAMHKALSNLDVTPEHILVDGNRFMPFGKVSFDCIIKGDGKYVSIAAASILAKVYRDRYMSKLAKKFPGYCWEKNKGYPTLEHRNAIQEIGPCKIHRKSFQLLKPQQLNIFK